jgi:transglutaminase/protease-like cytokinesis protein 3
MALKNCCTIALLLFTSNFIFGQNKMVRQHLLHYAAAHPPTAEMGLEDIVDMLSVEAKDETDKAWIAFYWIAEHIDYETADSESKGESLDLNQVIQQQKGNVNTFSQLYRELCVLMGLQCHIVPGYIRMQLGVFSEYNEYTGRFYKRPNRPEHTWNAVKIGGDYYFIDVSMGSSILGGDSEEVIFIKKYDFSYVLVNEYPFIATHLPADPRWQMRDYPISLRMYYTDWSYTGMIEKSKDSPLFDYQTAITKYEAADEASQRLMRLKSTYEFYPTPFNARQVADAYYNMAYSIAQQPYSNQVMMDARRYYQQAINAYEELDQDTTVKQLLSQARQGITYVNYRLEHKQ